MPYSEVDTTNPLNAYGKSKEEGEKRVLKNSSARIDPQNFVAL